MTKGISTRTTSIGFHVLRLHYSSDPDKDPATEAGRRWYEQARTGMSDARWRKEYEIDYGALSGQLVFPGFDPGIHVVEEFKIDPHQWTIYMACDPHPRTPHAFVWLCVNREGEMVVKFSWWPQDYVRPDFHATVKEHYAESVKLVEDQLFGGSRGIRRVMDSAGKGMNASEERSYFDAYREAGLHFWEAKKNRDLSGFDLITEALRPTSFTVGNEKKMKPRLTIQEGNDELVWQIKHLRFSEWRGNVTDKDPPEKAQEKRRHLVDCLVYILLNRPRFIDRRQPENTWQPIDRETNY
jgi:hypothetical protein